MSGNILPHNNSPPGFNIRFISFIIFFSSIPTSVAAICVSNIITKSAVLSFSGNLLLFIPAPSFIYLHSKFGLLGWCNALHVLTPEKFISYAEYFAFLRYSFVNKLAPAPVPEPISIIFNLSPFCLIYSSTLLWSIPAAYDNLPNLWGSSICILVDLFCIPHVLNVNC